jgi:hypothetical protein
MSSDSAKQILREYVPLCDCNVTRRTIARAHIET